MDDIAKNTKKTGIYSINRDDPDEYMKSRLKEDFNSTQLIACFRLSIALSQFCGPDLLRGGNLLFR